MSLRVGYAAYGFLSDIKIENGVEVSTPDGNASYSWSILHELQSRGYKTYWMHIDRDREAYQQYGPLCFSSFSQQNRLNAYNNTIQTNGQDFPELDILLIEWRFPIPGRNCYEDGKLPETLTQNLQPDLYRQSKLLQHYMTRKTKIIIWDLDHKLTEHDEMNLLNSLRGIPGQKSICVLETSSSPLNMWLQRIRVEPPILSSALLEHKLVPPDISIRSAYIGSRYERDDVITEWLGPLSSFFPSSVHFYGNWLKTLDECKKLWPHVSYHDRVTMRDFYSIYSKAISCPLLAKKSYLDSGFITPRPWEAIIFGTLPVGLGTHRGIEQYTNLIAKTPAHMISLVGDLSRSTMKEREIIREEIAHLLSRCDVKYFVNIIEDVTNN